jgi:hypothetical protein
MKALLTLLAVLAIVVPASAFDLGLNFGNPGQTAVSGYYSIDVADNPGVNPLSVAFDTGKNITITAGHDNNAWAAPLIRCKARPEPTNALWADALQVRDNGGTNASGTPGVETMTPYMRVQISGLELNGMYDLAIGSRDTEGGVGEKEIIRAAADTTGAQTRGISWSNFTTNDPNNPQYQQQADPIANVGLASFTANAAGVLTFEVAWDNANSIIGNGYADAVVDINWLTLTQTGVAPEPATMALLVLGGLGFLRRRR